MIKFSLLLAVVFLLLVSFLGAQVSENITLQSSVLPALGYACDIKVTGNLAFVSGALHRLMCFDVSNPSQPMLLSYAEHNDDVIVDYHLGEYGKLLLNGDYAYFFVEESTVGVYDISNPHAISFIADITSLPDFTRSTKVGDRLYVAGSDNDLEIWDLSSPLAPLQLGSYIFPRYVADVQVNGDYAFVAHGGIAPNFLQLSVLDISNPQFPGLLNTINGGGTKILYYNDYLYAFNSEGSNEVKVYSLTDPFVPLYVTSVSIPFQNGSIEGLIDDGFLYLNCVDITVEDRGYNTIVRYDLANPALPAVLDNLTGSFVLPESWDVENNRLFITEPFYQLGIYAPANSNTVVKVGQIQRYSVLNSEYALGRLYLNNGNIINCAQPDAPSPFFANSVYMTTDGNSLYTTLNTSIYKWELCLPDNPSLVASVSLWNPEYETACPISVVGDYIYSGRFIINTSLSYGSLIVNNLIGTPKKIVTRDNYAYASYNNSLKIFNIADPTNPVLENTISFTTSLNDFCIDGNLLVTAPNIGLRIYQLNDPLNPQILCYIPDVSGIRSLRVSGHYLLSAGDEGIRVYSLYNPSEPVSTGYYYQPGDYYADLEIVDNIAYVCQYKHMGIYDFSGAVSNPENPLLPQPAIHLSNYPNPFIGSTTITLSGKTDKSPWELSIYNLKGQKVKCLQSGNLYTENNSIVWNGMDEANRPVAAGVYLCRFSQGNTIITKALLMIK